MAGEQGQPDSRADERTSACCGRGFPRKTAWGPGQYGVLGTAWGRGERVCLLALPGPPEDPRFLPRRHSSSAVCPISLLRISLLRLLDPSFPGNPLWT